MLIENECYLEYCPEGVYTPADSQTTVPLDEFCPSVNASVPRYTRLTPVQGNVPYDCACPTVPTQQSFLHQILTGKGYKNGALCLSQFVKMEAILDMAARNSYCASVMHDGFTKYHRCHRH